MAAEVETENLILVVNCSKYMTPEDLVKRKLQEIFTLVYIYMENQGLAVHKSRVNPSFGLMVVAVTETDKVCQNNQTSNSPINSAIWL